MITIGCACNKSRAAASATAVAGTYRVMVNDRKVYETSSGAAAEAVADRFDRTSEFSKVKILAPGETA